MMDRRWAVNIPWGMVGIVAGIVLIGLSAVYSATYTQRGPSPLFYKQMVWMGMALFGLLLLIVSLFLRKK